MRGGGCESAAVNVQPLRPAASPRSLVGTESKRVLLHSCPAGFPLDSSSLPCGLLFSLAAHLPHARSLAPFFSPHPSVVSLSFLPLYPLDSTPFRMFSWCVPGNPDMLPCYVCLEWLSMIYQWPLTLALRSGVIRSEVVLRCVRAAVLAGSFINGAYIKDLFCWCALFSLGLSVQEIPRKYEPAE